MLFVLNYIICPFTLKCTAYSKHQICIFKFKRKWGETNNMIHIYISTCTQCHFDLERHVARAKAKESHQVVAG